MKSIFTYLIFIAPLLGFSQLHHQMISSHGSTNTTSEGFVITQTIGQQSITGNSEVAGLVYGQGFQQSIWTRLINSNDQNFMAEYYPNPFIIDDSLIQRCYFPQEYLMGDVNQDSVINILDIVFLMNYILNLMDLNEEQIALGDLNNDNGINILDILLLIEEIIS